jgi:hypothetical protein
VRRTRNSSSRAGGDRKFLAALPRRIKEHALEDGLDAETCRLLLLDEGIDVAAPAAQRIWRLTGEGHPKALELFIGRTRTYTVDYLLDRLREEPALPAELQRLIMSPGVVRPETGARTAGSLLSAAEETTTQRRQAAAASAERARKRREEEAARARAEYLQKVAQRQPSVWKEIRDLVAMKQPASYDLAVGLLVDLRDVAISQKGESDFRQTLADLCVEHARKPSFLSKVRRAGLPLP